MEYVGILLCVAIVAYVFVFKKDKKEFPKDPSDYRPPMDPEDDEVNTKE